MHTTSPVGRGPLRRRSGALAAVAVVGALLSAGVLAGCGDSASGGAASEPTTQTQNRDMNLPPATSNPNPDTNRERAFERAGVLPTTARGPS